MLRESSQTIVYNNSIIKQTTTYKGYNMKASPRIILVGPRFQQEFLTQTQASYFRAVRETTQAERHTWITERVQKGENMMDCAGESVIPPHTQWIDLLGKLIQIDKVRCKVPFTNSSYRPFKNYGCITVWSSCLVDNTCYMPSDQIRIIQSLIKEKFDHYDGIYSHLYPY